jgi:O-antigen/teichoic acid export membrane protein
MNSKHSKYKILSALFWKLMERGGTQGIQFIIQIVLARLLAPEQFGTIAIVMVFISIATVFVQSGFNTALIQKKDADEIDFSSVFYLSLIISGMLYVLIYLIAPSVANFYRDPVLMPVLRILSLTLFFGAYNSIQNAYIARKMEFKKLFLSSFGAIVISGILGIISAYQGLGVWSLVIQQLVNQVLITIILFFVVKWKPQLVFSLDRLKILFSFGSKLLASSLLNVLYINLRTLIVGRTYNSETLGFYNRGEQFPKVIVTNIDGSIQTVMLPTLSAFQDDKQKVKQIVRRSILTSSFIIFPIMIGMAAVAEPLVKVVLTDKWIQSVPFLQIFCVSYAVMPIHTANLQAINALGRSDIFLKLEILKKVVGVGVLLISIPLGIYAIAIGMVFSGLISSFLNAYPNKQLLNYSYFEQLKDIFPSLLISLVMGIVVYLMNFLDIEAWKILLIQIALGSNLYIVLSITFKNESLYYLIDAIKQLYINRRH